MSGRAMLRVAAAESPSVKWGGLDIGAYEAAPLDPGQALGYDTSQGDVFGTCRQVTTHMSLYAVPPLILSPPCLVLMHGPMHPLDLAANR